jgi:uncharacterized protein (TIGR03435 family)
VRQTLCSWMLRAMLAGSAVFCPSPLAGQPASVSPAFEAASIRLHKATAPPQVPELRNGPLAVSSSLIRLKGYTVFGLILDAWNLRGFQVSPARDIRGEDIADTTYDIVARAPGTGVPAIGDVRAMLRALLAERFGLKVHWDSRRMPVYALVASKGPPKLRMSEAGGACSVQDRLTGDGRNHEVTFANCGTNRLVDELGHLIRDRPVLDRTGLIGQYNFRLVAIPWYRTLDRFDPEDIDPIAAVGELGLKLVPGNANIDMLVVDHLAKPIEN